MTFFVSNEVKIIPSKIEEGPILYNTPCTKCCYTWKAFDIEYLARTRNIGVILIPVHDIGGRYFFYKRPYGDVSQTYGYGRKISLLVYQ